ncbi:protein kinase [Myxococcaceae bacterium GXIMD 01537]
MSTDNTGMPRTLGRYELVHLLGQGGMGEVWLAKISGAAGFEKPCIVKTVLPALLKDRQFLDRFHHEAKVLVHLVHSSIAQVYDMGEAEGVCYIALEYVAGVDLAYLVEQARASGRLLPVPVALYLAQRMAEGLGYAHRKAGPDGTPLGIVHRDVSPHNVMVSYEGEVKVIDFGLAKSAARSKYTLPSTVMGKLGYMSPEQARAEPVDHRSDIYSCGVVAWELLAGRGLVAHGTVGEMMAAMSNPTVPALHELRPDVTPELDAVVRRALAPGAEGRYARADDFARALAEQFIRSGATLGGEEVGQFVRELCPDAFAAQRRLISKISSPGMHRTPVSPLPGALSPAPAADSLGPTGTARFSPVPAAAPVSGYEATALRPAGTESAPPGVTFAPEAGALAPRVEAPPSAPPAPAATEKRLSPAAFTLLALVLVGAGAGATALLLRPEGGGAPALAFTPPQGAHPPPPHDGHPHPPGMPPPPHDGRPPRDGHPPPPEGYPPPPPPRHGEEGPPPEAHPEGMADPQDTLARPGGNAEGMADPQDTLARPGGNAEAPSAHVDAPAPEPTTPRKAAALIAAKVVTGMFQDGKEHFVRAGSNRGLEVGARVPVVGPAVKPGKHRRLGEATVLEVWPMLARVSLDEEARAATGKRFAVLPDAPVAPPPPEPAPAVAATPPPAAPAPARHALVGRASFSGLGPFRKVTLFNTDTRTWNGCKVVLLGRRSYAFGALAPGGQRGALLRDFHIDAQVPFVEKGRLRVLCEEGEGDFFVRD